MRIALRNFAFAFLSASFFVSSAVAAASVEILFDVSDRSKTLFPSDLFTVFDFSQNTLRRVDLPKPACTPVIRCDDVDVLNALDGFNIQPRLSIPFSGPIDVATVNSDSVYLFSLGSTTGGGSIGEKVGINQIVWNPATNTLHAESDELLEQHTRYALIVTDSVLDTRGHPVEGGRFERFRHDLNFGQTHDSLLKVYRAELLELLATLKAHGKGKRIIAASVFTTMSTTSDLEKIQAQVKASQPAPARFDIGTAGERAVFQLGNVASASFVRQVGTAPVFQTTVLPLTALFVRPGVGTIAFGSYVSPNYEAPGEFIPRVGTLTGTPAAQGSNTLYFTLVVPAGTRPAAGWPIAIFGHGFGDNRLNSPYVVAASMAEQGIATIAINVVGHGGGPLGSVVVNMRSGAPVIVPAGGRGIDQNGDGRIDSTEGSSAAAPRALIGSSDGLRQTTIDLMQLVRQVQVGIDLDGDGVADFDPARIYYFGQSFGGMYGTILLGVERDIHVGVPNVPGGAVADIIRLSPTFRPLFNAAAAVRGLAGAPLFTENLPLRDQPPLTNNLDSAMALQDLTEALEWAAQAGNPVAYAPYIRKAPLDGNLAKSVIYQIAKGDQTVPNPTASAILRAGGLADRTTYYRNDLAFALGSGVRNPHTFLTSIAGTLVARTSALQAQAQIATFFASDGLLTIDPDGAGALFETPIVPPLPETLNFLP